MSANGPYIHHRCVLNVPLLDSIIVSRLAVVAISRQAELELERLKITHIALSIRNAAWIMLLNIPWND